MPEIIDFTLDMGLHALFQLLSSYGNDFSTVLDIGCGGGEHTRFLRLFGKEAYSTDLHEEADYRCDFLSYDFGRKFDAVFCSHVIEHQRNVGLFVEKIYDVLEDDGVLAIATPCHPRELMLGGHITNWNSGLLVYNLILGGFDCRNAHVLQDRDLNLVVRKRPATGGDIRGPSAWTSMTDLADYFPFPVEEGMNCEVFQVNWDFTYRLPAIGRPVTLQIKSRSVGDMTLNCL